MPGRKSPYGIHVDSPDQRQWISFESLGSIRRIASIVWGALASQRALIAGFPSAPTVIRSSPIERSIRAPLGRRMGQPSTRRSSDGGRGLHAGRLRAVRLEDLPMHVEQARDVLALGPAEAAFGR